MLPSIPKLPNGQYDYDGADQQAHGDQVDRTTPSETKANFNADANIPYDIVIETLDAMRQDEDGKVLFPDIVFAAGIL